MLVFSSDIGESHRFANDKRSAKKQPQHTEPTNRNTILFYIMYKIPKSTLFHKVVCLTKC